MAEQKEYKNLVLNDESKLDKFLEILPENKVYDFLDELASAQYEDVYNEMLYKCDNYIKTVFSNFQSTEINRAFQNFNEAFKKLNKFLLRTFSRIYTAGMKNKLTNMVGLFPDHRNSTETKREFWMKQFQQLEFLCSEFENKYRNFLKIAHTELSKEAKIGLNIIKGKDKTVPLLKHITSLTVVRPNSDANKFSIIVNGDYKKTLKGDRAKLCWKLLFDVAEVDRSKQ